MAYTTVANVAEYLQETITSGSTPSSDTVSTWIDWAKAEIDNETGQTWELTTSQQILNVDVGGNEFRVPVGYRPLQDVTSAEYNSNTAFSPSWTAYGSTDFYIKDSDVGIIHFATPLFTGDKKLRLTMTYGPTTVPDLIEYIATLMVSMKYIASQQSNTISGGGESIRVGPIAITQNSGYSIGFVKQTQEKLNDSLNKLGRLQSLIR